MRTIMILTAVVTVLAVAVLPATASRSDYIWLGSESGQEQVCDCKRSTSDLEKLQPPTEGRGPTESEVRHYPFNY